MNTDKIVCPYKPCGENENCVGCCHDPRHRPMSYGMFYEMTAHLGCGDCKYCDPRAEIEGVESKCKRLDHKHIQFAVPWFKSYDCGQCSGGVCSDFQPKEWELWLYRHWKPEFLTRDFQKGHLEYVGLCLDKDQSVRYYVSAKDFYYGTFLNEDGSLKWICKKYYKQDRKSPIGYRLITEYHEEYKNMEENDGI